MNILEIAIFVCGGGLFLAGLLMLFLIGVFGWRLGPSLLMTAGLLLLGASVFWPPLPFGFFALIVFICGVAIGWEGTGNPAPMNYPRGR